MKKFLGLLGCLYLSFSYAQDVSIKQGTEFQAEQNSSFNYYVGNDDSGIYIRRTRYKGKGTSYLLQKLDPKTLKPVYTADFELEPKEEPYTCQLKKDKILFFTTKYDGKDKMLLMRELNASNGAMIGSIKQLASLPSDPFGVSGRSFYISFSPDNTKMMIVSEFQWPKKMQEVSAEIYEYPSYKKLVSKKIIDSYGQSGISSYNYQLDNNGGIFHLFNYMIDFEEGIVGRALAHIPYDDQKTTVTTLPFDKLEIQNGTFTFVNDKLVFCGVFKDIVKRKERKEGKVKNVGVFSFFIDPATNTIISKGYDYFPEPVKEKLNYKDGLVEADPAQKYYSFEEIFTFNDNVYLIESHSYTISGNNSSHSYERELIVSKFNKTGKMEWMKVIPKFTADNLNSFNYLVNNNKVYLFYCEHPKNLEESTVTDYNARKYHDIKNYNGSELVCTTFDEAGNLSRKELFRNEGWCYDPISTNITLSKNNDLVLRMINHEQERYDVIKVK